METFFCPSYCHGLGSIFWMNCLLSLLCNITLLYSKHCKNIRQIRTWILDPNFCLTYKLEPTSCFYSPHSLTGKCHWHYQAYTRECDGCSIRIWLHQPSCSAWCQVPVISCLQTFSSTILKLIPKSNSNSNHLCKIPPLLLITAKFSPTLHFSFVLRSLKDCNFFQHHLHLFSTSKGSAPL